jgi:hypothetical protein
MDLLGYDVAHPTRRAHAVPCFLQVLTAILYYATGSFQLLHADIVHISQPTTSRILRVTEAIVRKVRSIIKFPFDEAGVAVMDVPPGKSILPYCS